MGTAFLGYVFSPKWDKLLRNLSLDHLSGVLRTPYFAVYFRNQIMIKSIVFSNKLKQLMLNFESYNIEGESFDISQNTPQSSDLVPSIDPTKTAKKVYKNLHLVETQLQIKNENRQKSAIYCIFNIINGKFYIGSATTNRINVRFRNHCINGTGNSNVKKAINKYGLQNFYFLILEYYPGIVLKENLKKAHLNLLALETHYLTLLQPEYNILKDAGSSTGYKHSEETKSKMKENYELSLRSSQSSLRSDERKIRIGNFNKGRGGSFVRTNDTIYSDAEKAVYQNAAYQRYLTQPNLRERLSKLASKPVILFLKDEKTVHSKYPSVRNMAKVFGCCHKTINKSITNMLIFKDIGFIKYDDKTNNKP